MKTLVPRSLFVLALAAASLCPDASGQAWIERDGARRPAEQFDMGNRLYEAKCAVCHGFGGRGDGPYAGVLPIAIPDLTTLARRNKDVFPFQRVYEIIDGRLEIAAHGRRDMPIWGSDLAVAPYPVRGAPLDPEFHIRMRILALTEYVSRLQNK